MKDTGDSSPKASVWYSPNESPLYGLVRTCCGQAVARGDDIFDDMAWSIGALPSLVAHRRVFSGLKKLLDTPVVRLQSEGVFHTWTTRRAGWVKLLSKWESICDQVLTLEPDCKLDYRNKAGTHPIRRYGMGTAPLTTVLYLDHEFHASSVEWDKNVVRRYHHLQAMLLVATLDIRWRYSSGLKDYLGWTPDGSHSHGTNSKALDHACRTARSLSEGRLAQFMTLFPLEVDAAGFARNLAQWSENHGLPLRETGLSGDSNLADSLGSLSSFFHLWWKTRTQDKVRPDITRNSHREEMRDLHREAVDGYIGLQGPTTGNTKTPEPLTEAETPAGVAGDVAEEPESLTGIAPGDLGTAELPLVSAQDIQHNLSRQRWRQMHEAMNCRLAPWDIRRLAPYEARTIVQTALAELHRDGDQAEGALLTLLMLALGQPLSAVIQMRIARVRAGDAEGGRLPTLSDLAGLQTDAPVLLYSPQPKGQEPAGLLVPALVPTSSGSDSAYSGVAGGDCARNIFLPMASAAVKPAVDWFAGRSRVAGVHQPGWSQRLFAQDEGYEKKAQELVLKFLESCQLPAAAPARTLKQLVGHLGQTIVDITGDDTLAWLITHDRSAAGEARMYYTQHSLDRLAAVWLEALARGGMESLAAPAMDWMNWSGISGLMAQSAGARFVATTRDVRTLLSKIQKLASEEFDLSNQSSLLAHHNHLVVYTLILQGLCSGLRAIRSPVVFMRALEQSDRVRSRAGLPLRDASLLAGVADKETYYNQRARLVMLQPALLKQLRILQKHQQYIAVKLDIGEVLSQCSPAIRSLFRLDAKGQPREVSVRWLEEQLAGLGFPWPANFTRAFLRTRLLERGTAAADLDALLGHRDKGGGAIGLHSTFDNSASLHRLAQALQTLHEKIGLTVLESRLGRHTWDDPGANLLAPLHRAGPLGRGLGQQNRTRPRPEGLTPFWADIHQRAASDDRDQVLLFYRLNRKFGHRSGNVLAQILAADDPVAHAQTLWPAASPEHGGGMVPQDDGPAMLQTPAAATQELVQFFKGLAEAGTRARFQLAASWFRLLLHAGKKLARAGVRVPETPLVAVTRLPTSPFMESSVLGVPIVEGWRSAVTAWSTEAFRLIRVKNGDPPEPTSAFAPEGWATALLMSAALNGMLLDMAQLSMLLHRLCTRRDLPLSGQDGRAHLDFRVPGSGSVARQLHRWWLDPMTELIWLHAPAMPRLLTLRDLHPWLRRISVRGFRSMPARTFEPGSFSDLLRCAEIGWLPHCSRTAVASHRRQIDSSAVLTTRWGHLAGAARLVAPRRLTAPETDSPKAGARRGKTAYEALALVPYGATGAENRDSLEDRPHDDGAVLSTLRALHPWVEEIAQQLMRCKDDGIDPVKVMAILPAEADPVARSLADFAVWLSRTSRAELSGAAAGRNFSAVAQSVLQSLKKTTVHAVPDAWKLAQLVLDIDEDPIRSGATAALRQGGLLRYAGFLGIQTAVEERLEQCGTDSAGSLDRRSSQADARILSFDDIAKIEAALPGNALKLDTGLKPGGVERGLSILLLALCFYCGLRPGEAYGLRLMDIDLEGGFIRVEPYEGHPLKSRNAHRRVPFAILMHHLKERFERFVINRRKTEPATSRLLGTSDGPLDRAEMDEYVHRVMRHIACDGELRLYHARHSFATWMDLALRSCELPELRERFAHLPLTHAFLSRGEELTRQLFGSRNAALGRTSYAIARLVGHIGPAITHMHYIHGEDLVRAAVTGREALQVDKPQWGELLGLRLSSAYRLIKGDSAPAGAVSLARRRLGWKTSPIGLSTGDQAEGDSAEHHDPSLPDGDETSVWIPIAGILDASRLLATERRSVDEAARLYGIEPGRLDAILAGLKAWLPEVAQPGKAGTLNAAQGRVHLYVPATPEVQSVIRRFEARARQRASADATQLQDDLRFLIGRYDRRDRDFHAAKPADLQRLFRLMAELGLDPSSSHIITRAADPEEEAAHLASRLPRKELGAFADCPVKCIKVRSLKKASSYRQWIGLMPFAGSESCGHSLAVAMVVALVVVGASCAVEASPDSAENERAVRDLTVNV